MCRERITIRMELRRLSSSPEHKFNNISRRANFQSSAVSERFKAHRQELNNLLNSSPRRYKLYLLGTLTNSMKKMESMISSTDEDT